MKKRCVSSIHEGRQRSTDICGKEGRFGARWRRCSLPSATQGSSLAHLFSIDKARHHHGRHGERHSHEEKEGLQRRCGGRGGEPERAATGGLATAPTPSFAAAAAGGEPRPHQFRRHGAGAPGQRDDQRCGRPESDLCSGFARPIVPGGGTDGVNRRLTRQEAPSRLRCS